MPRTTEKIIEDVELFLGNMIMTKALAAEVVERLRELEEYKWKYEELQ